MIEKLSQREKRTLKIGAVFIAAILLFVLSTEWLERWTEVRKSLALARAELKVLDVDEAKRAGLLSVVPSFEMPQSEERQKFLFRDKLNEQLKKAGINSRPLQILPAQKSQRQSGYKLLRLQCRGKCQFGQLLDLLAGLNENPYLVGIEEMRIKCNPENREEFEIENLTVSTFAK
jgi:hypothetical protein